jgi:uncharacterized protein YbcC (UPF0753/DUF2309 family)
MLREQESTEKSNHWSPVMPHAAAPVEALDWSIAFRRAARRLIKVSSLETFIAQNPWAGFEDQAMRDVDGVMQSFAQASVWMPLSFYREEWQRGRIQRIDVTAVLASEEQAGRTALGLEEFLAQTDDTVRTSQGPHLWPHLIGLLPGEERLQLERNVLRWLQAYYDEHHAVWIPPRADRPLWSSWKHLMQWDFSLSRELGEHLRKVCIGAPQGAGAAIAYCLQQLKVPPSSWESYLTGHLYRYPGWAGYLRYRDEEGSWVNQNTPLTGELVDLLAILLAYELALVEHLSRKAGREVSWSSWAQTPAKPTSQADVRRLWHLAYERAFQRSVLNQAPLTQAKTGRVAAQAVFCIDVRSEALRRRWEAKGAYRGYGFAGFFGVPLEIVSSEARPKKALYPAIVVPQQTIQWQARSQTPKVSLRHSTQKMLKYLLWSRMPAASAFGFIELFGYTYGLGFVQRWLQAWGLVASKDEEVRAKPSDLKSSCQAAPEALRLGVAKAVLSCLGDPSQLARLVALLGHGAQGTNNPFASALQCGACGGHAGGINARLASAILNDSTVRKRLAEEGLHIPDDTWFVAGEHHTTEQTVELYDIEQVPASHRDECLQLQADFARASTELERIQSDGEDVRPAMGSPRRLARDWSALRPEWGLSGHALFVIGFDRAQHRAWPESRFFLHSYEAERDADGAQLKNILAGPVMVAADINLHYYGASLAAVSSGDKMLHTVTGRMGVIEGPWGDLRYGLPQQSLTWNGKPVHEPLRLTVVIDAAPATLDAILKTEARLKKLIDGEWLQLVVWDAARQGYYACQGVGRWSAVTPT